jgi:AraC family transcriptional regulator, L-rhamnose operon regulatory protein RhaS
MKRYLLHSPFSIYHFESMEWNHPVHKHSYFEIIFILKGNGIHNIKGNSFSYAEGDVFLLGPEDFHYFEIESLTEFCFVRFNDSIYKNKIEEKDPLWHQILTTLLYTSSHSRGSIVRDKHEQGKLLSLLSILEAENENPNSKYFESIRNSLLQNILVILARNLFEDKAMGSTLKDSTEELLSYIKLHIHEPAKLTIEHLAAIFSYSPDYISIFFKKQTGESIKQYITKYKMKLIEIRLLYSQLPIKDIADEFGYLDESHFCKQFKKFMGSTPSNFRKVK